ncbi:MAG: gluconate 2-dehydrogenase subunit 3 family protein, partial [Longimicrobiales bacterium]
GGLAALDGTARSAHGAPLAELAPAEQDEVIASTESEPWFFPLRLVVIAGVLSDPHWGGNRDGAGWELLGIEHAPVYAPPFGYYDAERARSEEADA